MEDQFRDPLLILGQLAREYEEKYKQLQEIGKNAQPDTLAQELGVQAELTTDRFRTAQLPLLKTLASLSPDGEREKAYMTAVSLCRCFDEMRILFQMLMQCLPGDAEQKG